MKDIITKELLNEVLGKEVIHIEVDKNTIVAYGAIFQHSYINGIDINIHELAHKVKEWVLTIDRGYTIDSCIKHTKGKARVGWYEKNHSDKHGAYREHQFYSDWFEADNNSEPEAIFQAGQWILENR